MLEFKRGTDNIILPPASAEAVIQAYSLTDEEVNGKIFKQMIKSNPRLLAFIIRIAMLLGSISDPSILSVDGYLQGAGRYFHALEITATKEDLLLPQLDINDILTYAKDEGNIEFARGIFSISALDYTQTILAKRESNWYNFVAKEREVARELVRIKPAFIYPYDDYSAVEGGMLDVYGIFQNYYLAQKAAAMFNKGVN